jgi:hypothetical protein
MRHGGIDQLLLVLGTSWNDTPGHFSGFMRIPIHWHGTVHGMEPVGSWNVHGDIDTGTYTNLLEGERGILDLRDGVSDGRVQVCRRIPFTSTGIDLLWRWFEQLFDFTFLFPCNVVSRKLFQTTLLYIVICVLNAHG